MTFLPGGNEQDRQNASTPEAGSTPQCLWVARLRLTDFRNYPHLALDLDHRPVILTGANGSGKTNLMEAVSLLSPGQGLRRSTLEDMARHGGSGLWAVSAKIYGLSGVSDIGTGLALNPTGSGRGGRVVKIEGNVARGSGTLAEHLNMVWMTPALDGLFSGPAAERRRFLDRLILGLEPGHRKTVSQFERAMRQRNKLLDMNESDQVLFDGIERQMAELGVAVAAIRMHAVDRLAAAIEIKWPPENAAPFPWSTLSLEGVLEDALRDQQAAVDVEDMYARMLATNRGRDRAARRTLVGPHRSDLIVGHGPKAMPAKFCSTGEQKAMLVGLMLAYSELLKELHDGLAPIILLDEIAAHLDETRRNALFKEILRLGAQAWMTGTDKDIFMPFGSTAQFFSIDNADII